LDYFKYIIEKTRAMVEKKSFKKKKSNGGN
jgi:hypothetical protein